MDAAIFEAEARADYEVLHGARDDDLARLGERGNPGADVYGDAADVVSDQLALAGVNPGAQCQAEPILIGDRGASAPDRAGRTIERGEETVARSLDLLPPEAIERGPYARVGS